MENEEKSCPSVSNCELYKQFTFESTKNILMMRYCKGDYDKCERRIRAFSEDIIEVPYNLLPNGQLLKDKTDSK